MVCSWLPERQRISSLQCREELQRNRAAALHRNKACRITYNAHAQPYRILSHWSICSVLRECLPAGDDAIERPALR